MTGCGPSPGSVQGDRPPVSRYCGGRTRAEVVCRQFERASFFTTDRRPLDLHIEGCAGWEQIRARIVSTDAAPYDALIRLAEAYEGGPLTPVSIQPVIQEWPCRDRCAAEDRVVRLPVVVQCDAGKNPNSVELTLPKIGLSDCEGQSPITSGDDPAWCTHPLGDDVARYRVAQLHFGHRVRLVEVDVGGTVSVKIDGQRVAVTEETGNRLREALERVWLPTHDERHCRDGGEIIEAVRQGAWRVRSDSCSSFLDMRELGQQIRGQ